ARKAAGSRTPSSRRTERPPAGRDSPPRAPGRSARAAGRGGRGQEASRRHNDATPPGRRQGLAGPVGEEDLAGVSDSTKGLAAVGISGSPSSTSKSRMLVEYALGRLAARGARTQLVDLATLPAEPLLGRGTSPTVTAALEAATRARIVAAGTAVYRATYSGLLKLCFDLLPQDGPSGKMRHPAR